VARGEVMRLSEVVTEAVDVTGLDAPIERKVRLAFGSQHVWPEQEGPVTVRIAIEPQPVPTEEQAPAPAPAGKAPGAGTTTRRSGA
jgi:hypothetical protein